MRKAYWTATVVLLSYAFLGLKKKIFGDRYYERRIQLLHVRNAERVKKAILQLNGLFIKIGQMLSILSNFLPEAFQKPLEELQDNIPARPFLEVRERIEKELGKAPGLIFSRFDETPLAAASVGQAHRAQLPNGTEVVVKIQHADIEEIAHIDLEVIKRLTHLISWLYNIKGMDYLYSQVRKMIEEELDYEKEAASMQQISKNLTQEMSLLIPEVHKEYSTRRVLTTTWHEGVKIANTAQIDAWNLDRRVLAANLLHAYCHMVFKDGFYHADPHPGNILVRQDGALVLLDFGATGRIGANMREGILSLIESAVKSDTRGMIEACRMMGFFAEGREAEEMAEKMIVALRNFLQNEVELEGLNFKDLKVKPFDNSVFRLIQDIGLSGISGTVQVPKDYVLLNRMLPLLLGICNTLDPKFNPLDVVRPYAQEFIMGQQGDLVAFVRKMIQSTLSDLIALPEEVRQTLEVMRKGRQEMRTPDVVQSARLLYLAMQQLLFTILALSSGTLGYWWLEDSKVVLANYAFGFTGLFVLLLLKSWRSGGRQWQRMK